MCLCPYLFYSISTFLNSCHHSWVLYEAVIVEELRYHILLNKNPHSCVLFRDTVEVNGQ